MAKARPRSVSTQWQRPLWVAVGCALGGVVVHFLGRLPSGAARDGRPRGRRHRRGVHVGVGGRRRRSGLLRGLVLAVIALARRAARVRHRVRFAFIQQAELVTANLTGATRLLLTGATALPLLVAFLARRSRRMYRRSSTTTDGWSSGSSW